MSSSNTEPVHALNLDIKQQTQFISFFNKLPEKPSATLRFFNHSEFYSLHGDDAKLGSDFTGNLVKFMGASGGESAQKLPYIVLRKTDFEKFIRDLLLVKQYRVEVYTKATPGKITEWNLEFKASPGNLAQFEDILFDSASITFNNYVMAIKIVKNNQVAAACVNSTELKFELAELHDNDSFTELEALIAQIGPRECLIPVGDSSELIKLRQVLERNGVLVAKVKRTEFNKNDVMMDLNRLLYFDKSQQRNSSSHAETNLTEAVGCLNAAIKFLNLTGDEQNFNQFKISTLDVNRCVRLDNAALYSLNILPKSSASSTGIVEGALQTNNTKSFSLKGILDCCITPQGRRLLEQWIKQPLKDINLVEERLDIVQNLVTGAETRETLSSDILTRLSDLLLLSKKLSSKKASLQDCYKVYQIVSAVPTLLDTLNQTGNACIKSTITHPIGEIYNDLEKYQQMIEEILDMTLVDKGEFLVKKDFDPELDEISKRKDKIYEKIQQLSRKASDDLGFDDEKTVKLEYNDQHGYFLRVTLKEEHALRSTSRYRILGAIKGGVRFTNDKLEELNEDYSEAKKAYEVQQKSVIAEIFDVAAGYGDSLRSLNTYIATVDVLVSFAKTTVSARIPYTRPKLHKTGSGILKLTKVRHPCLEQQDSISFIPNNVEFDRENGKILHIITGPNMCGKSTYIRSVGVCVLMAQIGCFVPCEYAEISLVDAILARVGAEDCQLKGLSTFMLEMIETATIVKTATENSLVIIDELGRGTSTYDGCGLAYSIAEYLANEAKCFSLFATHFHEITKLGELYPEVNNLHVTAVTTHNTITPLYQIREGPCDNSYGIHCARMADFPEDVIQAAIEHQKSLEHSAGTQLITDYEQVLKRKIIQEGDKIIHEALKKMKSLNAENLSDEELHSHLEKIKIELMTNENLFVKGLLS